MQENVEDHILDLCQRYGTQRGHKIEVFAISPARDPTSIEFQPRLVPGFKVDRDSPPTFAAKLWLRLDAIPMIIKVEEAQFSLQSRALAAVEKALSWLSPLSSSTIKIKMGKTDRAVLVRTENLLFLNQSEF